VDHYTVFLSTDGVNLMTVGDVPASQTAYDFSGYSLAPGSYEVYVKAVGVPFMLNHMSAAVALTVASQPPTVSLTVTPANTTAGKIVSASVVTSAGSIAATAIDFGDGTVLTGTAGSHAYKQAGTYTVRATVTDNLGASSNAVATVTVSTARRLVPQPQPVQGPVSFRRASM
jgi:PKD repeat protein